MLVTTDAMGFVMKDGARGLTRHLIKAGVHRQGARYFLIVAKLSMCNVNYVLFLPFPTGERR